MLNGGGGGRGGRPPLPPKKTMSSSSSYASIGRTASGRFVSLSRDDLDMSGELGNFDYTVQIPSTPDNQPMDPLRAAAEQQHASNTLFSGGSDMGIHGQPMRKMSDAESSHPQLSGRAGGLNCSIDGCDGIVIRNERGEFLSPCDCDFKICRDCYHAARGTCPSCKQPYKYSDEVEESMTDSFSIPTGDQQLKHTKSQLLMKNQNSDLDSSPWLYETKGSYSYDNATWPEDDPDYSGGGDGGGNFEMGSQLDPKDLAKRPLSRVINIRPGILIPYRLLVVIRLVALGFFLTWRVRNPNYDAIWLWGMSIVCELWFAFSWILDQMPKLNPVRRTSDLNCLRDKFESRTPDNPTGKSDLPGIDVFVSTADPEKEPPLTTANTILSILAADYPVDKLSCYLSDDGGALATFEALAEAASFAMHWIPFCRKHNIEPRNPEAYYNMKGDPTKNKVRPDFVKDRRRLKREYDEFKVRINSLPDSIRRRSDAYNAHEEIKARRAQLEGGGDPYEPLKLPNATWMADGTHWPGTWIKSAKEHSRGDHAGIIQVMLSPPSNEPLFGSDDEEYLIDTTDVDTRLPLLVYVSREKHAGYDHNKKAGAMNALVRSSAILSNGSFMLNLDCDHYIYNSMAMREGICFMLDKGGENICYVQFPQRFEGIDTHDRYANHNTVFFDCNMRALDGLQGPMYVGTGCLFRRVALYGFEPPNIRDGSGGCCGRRKKRPMMEIDTGEFIDEEMAMLLMPKRFGNSNMLLESIPRAEINGRPLADHAAVKYGRKPGTLIDAREPLDAARLAESISVISCWYEDKTEWGHQVGWIYGSVTEDVLTGYCMHKKGWRSVYCVTARDAFRGTAPINLTDRLHQVLRWATGSVEIFFSRNNGLLAGPRMKILQQIAYLNVGIYPFTSVFLVVYCFLPALSLYTNQFIVANLSVTFLVYLLIITITLCLLAILEVKWSGITLEEWWRNEQFWLIGGTSAHLAAVFQGLLKVIAGIDISFTLTAKAAVDENEDSFTELYEVKWTSLMIPPIVIMMVNIVGIAIGFARTIYSPTPEWSKLLGGSFFALWVLMHLYPFAKGLMGRRGRTPTIVWVWSGLLSITISLLWVAISNPGSGAIIEGQIQIP